MMPTTMLIIAGVLALVATVLAFIYVVPEKKREKLGAFGKFLHDTCNFKYLMVEKILQALYIFTTAAVIISACSCSSAPSTTTGPATASGWAAMVC